MTAEVAILNRSAVALAADSRVSIGGTHTEKTYDTQNKIFKLSKVHPVGILFYNNADFMGYIGNQIKVSRPYVRSISRQTRSYVRALAQHDIVHRFMEGIDPYYSAYLEGNIATALVEGKA